MRPWSIHPMYLDSKGLVALWREALLAKTVLEGKAVGYKNHPQLIRFKESQDPVTSINQYLEFVYQEALDRGYSFNKEKIDKVSHQTSLTVNEKQIEYEFKHLLNKLKKRDSKKYLLLSSHEEAEPHPLFEIIEGEIEDWEIL